MSWPEAIVLCVAIVGACFTLLMILTIYIRRNQK